MFIIIHDPHDPRIHDYQPVTREEAFAVARELCRDLHCRASLNWFHGDRLVSQSRFAHHSEIGQ